MRNQGRSTNKQRKDNIYIISIISGGSFLKKRQNRGKNNPLRLDKQKKCILRKDRYIKKIDVKGEDYRYIIYQLYLGGLFQKRGNLKK